MNWDQVKGNWKQVKGKVREQWGRLTDDDLDKVEGRRELGNDGEDGFEVAGGKGAHAAQSTGMRPRPPTRRAAGRG